MKVKHHDSIVQMFEPLYDSWMSDDDREEFVKELAATQGKSLSTLSDEIDVGISNGYTLEQQIELCKAVLTIDI